METDRGSKKFKTADEVLKSSPKISKSAIKRAQEMYKRYLEIKEQLEKAGIDTTPRGYTLSHPFEPIKDPTPPHPFRKIRLDPPEDQNDKPKSPRGYTLSHPFETIENPMPSHPFRKIRE